MAQPATISCVETADGATALLHPIRRRILDELDQPDSATGLARRLGLARQKVNYHLRELEAAGHVTAHSERRRGNCTERLVERVAAHYLIAPQALGPIGDADPETMRDRFSWTYLVATISRSIRELSILRRRADGAGKSLPTFTLQTDVRFTSAKSLHAFMEQLSNDVARLAAEHHDGSAESGRVFRIVLGAHPAITKTEAEAEAELQENES